jgi:hypothetical protein
VVTEPVLGKDKLVLQIQANLLRDKVEKTLIPDSYAPLLVDNGTRNRALAFYRRVRKQNFIHSDITTYFLQIAARRGFDAAEQKLNHYLREKPVAEQVRIYRHLYGALLFYGGVDITDGRSTFQIEIPQELAVKYPPNPYLAAISLPVTLTSAQYVATTEKRAEFFQFVKKLHFLSLHVADCTIQKLVDSYFNENTKLEPLILKFTKLAGVRAERDEIYARLQNGNAIKVDGGFVVRPQGNKIPYCERKTYLIQPNGEVKTMQFYAGSKENVYRLLKKKINSVRLEKCELSDATKKEFAIALKEVAPQLALVLLP